MRGRGAFPGQLPAACPGGLAEPCAFFFVGQRVESACDRGCGRLHVAGGVSGHLGDRSGRGREHRAAGAEGVEERPVRLADRSRAEAEDDVCRHDCRLVGGVVRMFEHERAGAECLRRCCGIPDGAGEHEPPLGMHGA